MTEENIEKNKDENQNEKEVKNFWWKKWFRQDLEQEYSNDKKIKYLIVGAGSTGITFASFLFAANKDVTLISKYSEIVKKAKREYGIRLTSKVKGDKVYNLKIKTPREYKEKADVIILCVRTPDILSTKKLVKKASHKNTIITSISNGFGIGYALHKKFPKNLVLDSNFVGKCRWYDKQKLEYLQLGEECQFNFTDMYNLIDIKILEQIKEDFTQSGMNTQLLSEKEFTEMEFERLITRSPFEATCIYYNISVQDFKNEKEEIFKRLCEELITLAKAMNINVKENFLESYYANFEKYKEKDDAHIHSSILNDIKNGQKSEIDFLFFVVIRLAKKYNLNLPTYNKIAEKFKKYDTLDTFIK